jgi:ribonuclease VapC
LERLVADDPVRLISAGTLIEVGIVVEARLGDTGGRELDLWLRRAEVETMAVDAAQADMARRAWRRFGRGRHPAGLNYGDCFAYALAVTHDEPLLFKGGDFPKTDVRTCA